MPTAPRPLAAILLPVLLLATGCGMKRPVLYPDPRLVQSGPEVANEDVDRCMEMADGYVGDERAKNAAKQTAGSAAVGGAAGAASGAVRGRDAGTWAGAGAAGAAAGSLMRGLLRSREPDPIFKSFVRRCLADEGYHVIGWR